MKSPAAESGKKEFAEAQKLRKARLDMFNRVAK